MVNLIVLSITVLISIIAFNRKDVFYALSFNAYAVAHRRQWYRVLSYGFIHANWVHLLVNMFVLWMFGGLLEKTYVYLFATKGYFMYLLLYLSSIVVATMGDLKQYKDDYNYHAVGASGATSAVIFAGILLYPMQKIYIFFIPIGIPAFIFGILFLIYSAYMSRRNIDNIGHNAHFYGAVYGFFFTLMFDYKLIVHFFLNIVDALS
ncbi:MAG TPA: rhomboid family intramembrane serine protease [Bacteroidales bacterium]|jgi:membrane associated rhomboid family serine protease|nr:rhomboid family intramembrane serine protease [Bacteroidales bacterium]HOR82456.1 rhomboid family intramembrane serine protease [Bacteroidales bacterium]HPJ91716.1 rhomboid family intramembrane serine protease [Bacteroidales bacterium]